MCIACLRAGDIAGGQGLLVYLRNQGSVSYEDRRNFLIFSFGLQPGDQRGS